MYINFDSIEGYIAFLEVIHLILGIGIGYGFRILHTAFKRENSPTDEA